MPQTWNMQKIAHLVIVVAGGGALLFLLGKYILPALLPFLIAWGAAFLLRPASCTLERRLHLPRKVGAVVLNLMSISLLFLLLFVVGKQIIEELESLLAWLGEHPEVVSGFLNKVNRFFERIRGFLPIKPGEDAPNYVLTFLESAVSSLVSRWTEWLGASLKSLPKTAIFVVVTVIASVYFALDIDRVNRAVLGLFSPEWQAKLKKYKAGASMALGQYVRAYLILMSLTFFMLFLGFLLLKIPYAFLLAGLFALVDVLPILGVGTMLIPWSLFCLVVGEVKRGILLLVLYGVIALVRQLAEPKIVGDKLGIPPLLMLVYLYAGLVIFGFWGIFVGPLVGLLIRGIVSRGKEPTSE
ncbi:MAG: sporulation integral membrane protein YtvI [Clostridia bacterium]|nr:sporulation integral membrane protein YtvI [Clostridia bacterium]